MGLLIHVRLFTCKYSCYELESRDSEENISMKNWKKTAQFIKVLPANKLYFQIPLLKLCHALKRWHSACFIYYYITTEFHYVKRDSASGCYVWVKRFIDILAHFSPSFGQNFDIFVPEITGLNVNISIFWKGRVTFRVMKLGRVIVDDRSNYVTFHKLNVRIVKNNNSDNESLSCLCSSAIGSSRFVYF